uniref:Uncharacterized protein n=1 Tax=Anguilla anguilla TaxID=7936 RepID=A0A0E9PS99_ANGAN
MFLSQASAQVSEQVRVKLKFCWGGTPAWSLFTSSVWNSILLCVKMRPEPLSCEHW